MATFLRVVAAVILVVLWHVTFDLTWWQSIFLGWLTAMGFAALFQILLSLREIAHRLNR